MKMMNFVVMKGSDYNTEFPLNANFFAAELTGAIAGILVSTYKKHYLKKIVRGFRAAANFTLNFDDDQIEEIVKSVIDIAKVNCDFKPGHVETVDDYKDFLNSCADKIENWSTTLK